MQSMFIAVLIIAGMLVLWTVSTQRRLVVLDENISNAMSQIDVQQSSQFDALTALLHLTKVYAKHESETLMETIKSKRNVITAKSAPEEVQRQEGVISEALGRISTVTEQYPELKANQSYLKTMGAVQTFEGMVRTSRLIYNDNVAKLNREIRMFPVSLIAGILGFYKRDYLDERADQAEIPGMK
ncbi:LemA family protein [Oscillibacter sp. GMB15532]|uniref:LemA family protein n=1 Tax=Oscillibacter sp. GMB15532 TaxID=3230022 RepID=UPI0034E036B5